jgi:general secretion pathway protein G
MEKEFGLNTTNRLAVRRRALRELMKSRRGMSLVEVMVVIAIILTLMGVLAFGVMSVFQSSKVDTTILTMGRVNERVEIHYLRKRKVPSSSEGLSAVYGADNPPKDSWGADLVYVSPGPDGHQFDIISYGADGTEGGSDNDADIKWSEVSGR